MKPTKSEINLPLKEYSGPVLPKIQYKSCMAITQCATAPWNKPQGKNVYKIMYTS